MDDLRERMEAALQLVHDLAQGKRSWTLSVPARPDYDPDLVLSSVLREALDHPERLMGEPHKPSGASIRCPRCGEKQEVVFKYTKPEVKPKEHPMAEQIRNAQAEVAAWPKELRDSVQLQGPKEMKP